MKKPLQHYIMIATLPENHTRSKSTGKTLYTGGFGAK